MLKVIKREFTRWFSVIMVIMLLFSYGWPGVGQAQTNSETSVPASLNKSHVQTKNKINKDLTKQFEMKGQVTFLLKMKDQVDTKKVAANAANKAQNISLSAAKTELKKRTAVVSALRAKSLDTQSSVKQFLQKQKKAGKVKSFESFYIVNAMAVTGSKDVAQELAKFGEVEKILPNRTRHLITSNHGKAKESSSKKKAASKTKAKTSADDDDAVEPNVEHIGAPQVWDMGIDGTGVVVGSLDSGVQWDHPALKQKYRGYDPEHPDQPNNEFNWFDARDGQDTPSDDNGHGTHTIGTMVGSVADGSNQVGVAPGAQWIAADIFGPLGRGTDTDILAAGEWMLAPKDAEGNPHPEKAPDIINNSWGGGPGMNEWYREMVQNWRAAGIFPVFAAGNVDNGNPGGRGSVAVPANYPESFAVGATDKNDELAGFSLQGPSPYDEIKPEVVAPGVSIRSSVPDSGYASIPGTSMAAPAVSGTVALMLQADASQTVDEIETILLNTAKPLTDAEFPESPNNGYGYGLVQAFEAVSAVTVGLGTIEGKVTKEGEDNEQPTYQHDAPDETYAGTVMPLQIAVQDNISIKSVTLQYRASEDENWQTIEAERVDGNYQEGVYKATIPADSIAEPSITYRWQIKDFGGNDVTSDLYDVTVKSAISVGYSTDFESAPMGWISYGRNNTWEWGEPVTGPDEAFSGEKVYGTNLDGDYGMNNDSTLMMPPVDLPEGESYLQFKQWHDFGSYASGSVLISTDRENWQQLAEFTDGSDGWVDGEVRLSEYAGQRVYIAFNVKSAFDWGRGWYLDDVALSDQPLQADPEPPTYDHDALTQMYVGMDTPLQISVQDNISVEQVELQYHGADNNEWTTVETNLVDGDESDGTYEATIPQDAISQPSLTYRWQIVDYAGNTVTSDAYQVSVKKPVTVGYSTDFESAPGWLSYGTNNSWERGVPTSGPGHAVSGDNVYATNLDGNYPGYSDSTLMMPTIQVPENGAFLQFKQWYKFDNFAAGNVLVSTDQQNWDMLAEFEGPSYFWQYVEADLSDYAGQRIFVAFQLDSNSYTEPGWYLDDVTLSDTSIFGTNQEIQPNKQNKTALKKVKAEDTLKKANDIKEKGQTKAKKQSEKSGDPTSTLKLGEPKNVRSPVSTVNINGNSKTNAQVSSLPLGASVSVVETGQSMNTDPRNGSYSMTHSAGTYTLQADAYGFYPKTRSVEIPKNGTVEANFTLQPVPKGTVTGTITNKATGEPVAGATLMLMEDPAIAPVTTDENGNYSITAYEGDYTLHVSAPEHYVKDAEITINGNDSTEQNVQLKPFIGDPGEIGYDDGTAENAQAFVDAGHGYAVKMSLPEGKDSAMVTGGKFLFANNDFPDPGGNEFQVEIWDASGKDGAPGKKLAGPIDATAIRDNTQWTKVDLSSAGVVVDGDFYMVYIQPKDGLESPGLSIDTSSPLTGRNWVLNGVTGKWNLDNDQNYMIRALVSYEVTSPVITSPKDNTYTNVENMTIEGETASSTRVTVLNNGDEIATTQSTDDGTFSADITLNDGENVLKATASNDSGTTEPSEPVTVILDQDKPELMISSPEDGWKTNDMAVTVEGTVTDDTLASVKVNDKAANVNEDGSYSHRMLLDKGENVIKVTATDKAGNEQSKQITVHAKFNELEISNLKPSEDKYLNTGESVRIEMDSEPGLDATFTIQRPLGNTLFAKTSSITELPMMEMEDGHYVGFWTVPSDWAAKEGEIRVMVSDNYGNESEKVADGKLLINVPNEKPEARFDLPRKVNPGESITFDGSNSMDPDGTIVKYEWDFGDGETTSGEAVEHSFSKRGKYRVTLTVTDNRGDTDVKTQRVHVRGKRH